MSKVRVAIIGQGRSGRNIHGKFFKSENNKWCEVVAVVETDETRRNRAKEEWGCEVFSDYRELYGKDYDLVVNATYSNDHYGISKDLLEHGMPVLVEKPMARNYYEAMNLIRIAKEQGVFFAVFQQSFLAPFYKHLKEVVASGKLGAIQQVSIAYNGFFRRWDWQTLQCRMGGNVYNTGPHPLGFALDFLDFSDEITVPFSKLAKTDLNSGDAEDYAKIILTAPGKPVVDVEISSNDAYTDYKLRILGSKGCYKTDINHYEMKYIVDGENPEQPVVKDFLYVDDKMPTYCSEQLITHEEQGDFEGTAFQAAAACFYEAVYNSIRNGAEFPIKPENIAKLINVIETVHGQNPMPVNF